MPVDIEAKLQLLGGTEDIDDLANPYCLPHSPQMQPAPAAAGIFHAACGGGRRIPLLRVLRTNVCELNCRYCNINARRDVRRASFKPEELARTFMEMYRHGMVAGLFLSSGVAGGPAAAAERMIQTVEILREREGFRGYVHLKIMPGQPPDLIERAVQLADRVSINLEAPTPQHLSRIAPRKRFWQDLVSCMREVQRSQRLYPGRLRAGQITQMVVGASSETDADHLRTAQWLYQELGVRRVYYSAYIPLCGEVLAPPAPKLREIRLYQADWLLRFYGFRWDELTLEDGMLPQGVDPKLAWALRHPHLFPLEVNRAPREALLRVPGIGPVSAQRLLEQRRREPLRNPQHLRAAGVAVRRALPFLLLAGRYLADRSLLRAIWAQHHSEAPRQLSLPLEAEPQSISAAVA